MDQITSPIVHIINISIEKSGNFFPDSWKVTRVCPVPKIDNSKCFIHSIWKSNIDSVTELHRKICCLQHYSVWLLWKFKWKGHSTATLSLKFKSDIRKALNRNEITISVLTDYSKAFDTVNHKTSLEKLVSLKFSYGTIKIIVNYLTNWHQYLQIDDQTSPKSSVHFRIPQGSILGPILFNIYVAELPPV